MKRQGLPEERNAYHQVPSCNIKDVADNYILKQKYIIK